MKAFITSTLENAPKTHFLFSCIAVEENENAAWIDISTQNLDQWVDDGELEELVVDGTIEYLPINHVITSLKHWIKKLRRGGKLIITGIDAYITAKAFVDCDISIEQFNVYLHGMSNMHKTVNLTLHGLVNFLQELGLRIEHKRLELNVYTIEGVRP